MTNKKPVVHYTHSGFPIRVGSRAIVRAYDHPDTFNTTPGHEVVTTEVIRMNEGTGEFETRNTVYQRRGES